MLLGQTVFVDSVAGDDTTGERGRQDLPFLTVTAAANAAQDGDTIFLVPGTYVEDVVLPTDRNLTIIGGEPNTTIIFGSSGPGISWSPDPFIFLSLRNVIVASATTVGLLVTGPVGSQPTSTLLLDNVLLFGAAGNDAQITRLSSIRSTNSITNTTGSGITLTDYRSAIFDGAINTRITSVIGPGPVSHISLELRSGRFDTVSLSGRTRAFLYRGAIVGSLTTSALVSDADGQASLVCDAFVGVCNLGLPAISLPLVSLSGGHFGSLAITRAAGAVVDQAVDARGCIIDGTFALNGGSGSGVLNVDMRRGSFRLTGSTWTSNVTLDRDQGADTGRTAAAGPSTLLFQPTQATVGTTFLSGPRLPVGAIAVPCSVTPLNNTPLIITASDNAGISVANASGPATNILVTWLRSAA